MLNELFVPWVIFLFFFNDTATTEIISLSIHDALLISFTAFTGALPVNVPPAGLLSMAMATAPVKLVTVSPGASRAATVTAGVIAAPTCVVLGCTPNARWVAGSGGGPQRLGGVVVARRSVPVGGGGR